VSLTALTLPDTNQVFQGLVQCKLNGGYERVLDTTTDPSRAGVALCFNSPTALFTLIQKLNTGALVDPSDPVGTAIPAGTLMATFCSADGHLSGDLFDDAMVNAALHGKTIGQLLFMCVRGFPSSCCCEAVCFCRCSFFVRGQDMSSLTHRLPLYPTGLASSTRTWMARRRCCSHASGPRKSIFRAASYTLTRGASDYNKIKRIVGQN
jgi:hypothetical protein